MTKFFKFTAISEGISYLILLINMLFIKPINMGIYKSLLFPVGMAHGILFIAYIYLAFMIKDRQNWSLKDLFFVISGSVIPFGTFYIEKKYITNE